jgi:hypothetical protein
MLGLLAGALLALPGFVSADAKNYIRILVDSEISLDEQAKTVNLALTITNDGDQEARSLAVTFPALNESFTVKDKLYPKDKVDYKGQISFEKMGIDKAGVYHLPYRVAYQDLNLYPFSAPFLGKVTYGVAPAKALVLKFEGVDPGGEVSLIKERVLKGGISNLSGAPVKITSLTSFGPHELPGLLEGVSLPFTLDSSKNQPLELKLSNAAALAGSQYIIYLLISGEAGGKHLAEEGSISVRLVNSNSASYLASRILLGLIIVAALALLLRKRRKA